MREQPRAAALRRAARGRVVPVAAGTDQRRLETRDGVRRDRRHAGAAVAVLVRLVGRVHAREGAERAHRRVRRALRPGEDRHAGAVLRVVALGGIHGNGDSREETRERRRRRRRERLAESRDGADGGARGRLGGGRRVHAAEADRKGPGSPGAEPEEPARAARAARAAAETPEPEPGVLSGQRTPRLREILRRHALRERPARLRGRARAAPARRLERRGVELVVEHVVAAEVRRPGGPRGVPRRRRRRLRRLRRDR